MKNCKEVLSSLCNYGEASLTGKKLERFLSHIESCKSCKALFSTYLKTIELAKELQNKPVPEEVTEKLRKKICSIVKNNKGGKCP